MRVWGGAVGTPPCRGDCDGDGRVAIQELVTGVGIALGQIDSSACSAFSAGAPINELVGAVGNALDGCPAPGTPLPTATPTPAARSELFVSSVLGRVLETYRIGLSLPADIGERMSILCDSSGRATVGCAPAGDGSRWTIDFAECSGGFLGNDPGVLAGQMVVNAFGDCATDAPRGVSEVAFAGEIDDDGFVLGYDTVVSGVATESGRLQVLLSGRVSNPCLGGSLFVSSTILVVPPGSGCPTSGVAQVAPREGFAPGTFDRIMFSADGIEIDESADGTVDSTFDGCDDSLLARCSSRLRRLRR